MKEKPTVNAMTHTEFEVMEDAAPFFAPVASDLVDSLIGQYNQARANIDRVCEIVAGELGNVLHYFIDGNCGDDRTHRTLYVEKLFERAGAVGSLDSSYWSKALALTDVYACMPQERKNQWNAQLKNPEGKKKHHNAYDENEAERQGRTLPVWEIEPLPHFEEATVRSTIESLLVARTQFMAEKVDGIFRALSGSHVTNTPEAFGKRMIVAGILNSYGSYAYERVGYLNDLRCVIAKFMGRDEPRHQGSTNALVEASRHRSGKWLTADGGAFRLRTYKCGTAHLEVHPDMAYRLNQILAYMHPHAIPAEFRQKPKRKTKEFPPLNQPLPFAVLDLLGERQHGSTRSSYPVQGVHVFRFNYDADTSHPAAYEQACKVLASIGGTPGKLKHYFEFDYDYLDALNEIRETGCVPDAKAHQFYPTPQKLANLCAELAEIEPGHSVLEPSAGQGDLAAPMPKDQVQCVEISPLHCAVLRAKGFANVVEADFLAWAVSAPRYDRIIANPPFSDGRARAHLEAAIELLKPGGRLVAIVPPTLAMGLMLDNNRFTLTRAGTFNNEFAGTGVSVCIVTIDAA